MFVNNSESYKMQCNLCETLEKLKMM